MKELFDQHPLPWVVDDNRAGHEGLVTVFDANGNFVVYTGNMEDCTWEDILLARLIAAAPDLYLAEQERLSPVPAAPPVGDQFNQSGSDHR